MSLDFILQPLNPHDPPPALLENWVQDISVQTGASVRVAPLPEEGAGDSFLLELAAWLPDSESLKNDAWFAVLAYLADRIRERYRHRPARVYLVNKHTKTATRIYEMTKDEDGFRLMESVRESVDLTFLDPEA